MSETPATPSPADPGPTPGASGPPTLDFSILLRGNWVGAAMAAVAAFGVAGALSLATAFLGAEDLDVKSALGMTALLTEATFGADFTRNDDATLGQFPLLATMLALAAAVLVFRRATARYAGTPAVFGDVVRAGLILSLLTTALAIVIKIVEPDLRGFNLEEADTENGAVWASYLIQDVGAKITTSMPGAVFLPFLLLVTVLFISSLVQGDWLTNKTLATVRAWLAAPIAGLLTLVVSLFGAGLFYVLAILVHQEDARSLSGVVGMISLLPSLGLRVLGLGSGASFGLSYEYGDQDEEEMERLSGFADEIGGLFWVSPVLAVAIALIAAWAVIRRSPDRTKVMRDVAVYLGVLVVAVPFLAKLANLTGTEGSGDEESTFWLGIDGVQTTLLFLLISAVATLLLLVLSGSLDAAAIKARLASLQSDPGKPSQQWGQQPPAPAAPPQASDATSPTPPPAGGQPPASGPATPPSSSNPPPAEPPD